jgi:DDE superfamily endonuclease
VVVALDDTLERRWGRRIRARGIDRDPVRSSHGHFVKASGLRWLSVMPAVPVPWAGRAWALPFLTVLAPSERSARGRGGRHKRLTDWARQALLQAARWLPGRRVVAVADGGFAALELLAAARRRVVVVTRLRLDARLFDPPPPRAPRTIGRPRLVGARLPTLARRLADRRTRWRRLVVPGWYGGGDRLVDLHGHRPVAPPGPAGGAAALGAGA